MGTILGLVSAMIPGDSAAGGKPSVALMPFENLSPRKDLDWLKSAIPENLMVPFSDAGLFRIVERLQLDKVLKEIKLNESGLVDPNDAPALGKFIGVRWMVLGSFQLSGNTILIKSRTVNVETAEVGGNLQVQGDLDRAFVLQDELGRKVLLKLSAEVAGALSPAVQLQPAVGILPLDAFERMEKARALLARMKTLELDPLRAKKEPQIVAALVDLQAVLKAAPDLPEALILAGRLACQLDDHRGEAEQRLKRAAELGSETAWVLLGHLYRFSGRNKEAAESYRKGLELNPGLAEGWYGLAVLAQLQRNWQEAADGALKALERNPEMQEAFFLVRGLSRVPGKTNVIQIPEARAFCMGLAALEAGATAKAAKLFQTSLERYPDLAQAHLGLGLGASGTGRSKALFRALELAPLNPEVNLEWARAALDKEDCGTAGPALEKYLALASEGEDLPWAREQLDACLD